ncbi:FGF receptor activating protein [Angomonas deanei]|uniref:Frag1/DRAM/Sfk1 family, putative n=1 Tax=Angomonas deanei TaxID=59799 RepID=A0A7G2C6M2_9TRYP|nr:FGF receptor activating protein [Angomonas deanei]CAD2215416.1 Frag1/DRAM/Sfk1 family, putative [Angomonas deanei]|eukprot:EPY20694.1 FGF receptor activating protein [Angomonas deanei]
MPPTHVFYIPAQYGPIFYAVITGAGLILSLYVGLAQHPKELLLNSCGPDHYEFWPSISACIGDFLPERQIWRVSFVLCACFRIAASMNVFNVFWQKGCGGMADIYALRHQPRQLLASSAFITLAMVWIDLWRLIGAVCWTMVASRESLAYHNVGFVPYVALCFLLQVCITVLCKRNQYNTSIYPSLKDAVLSLKIKRLAMYGEAVMSLGVTCFFLRHFATCAPGSFSLSTMCEWCFAFFNLLYDGCCFYEVKTEGWWMSTTPEKWLELTKNGMAHLSPRAQRSPVLDTSLPSIEVKDGASVLVDIEDDRAKLNGPAVLTNGETFISPDIILHRFNLCNGPSRAMLWCCDIYWWWLFIEILHNLVQHMYYMPLVAMQLSWEIALVGFLGMFVLLRVPKCRKWMTGPCFGARTFLKPPHHPPGTAGRVVPMYVFFFFCASLSHLHMLVKGDAGHKLAALSFGGLFIPLAVVTRSLYPLCRHRPVQRAR